MVINWIYIGGLALMLCTAYKSVSLLICATIAPNEKTFGTIGCNAKHINAASAPRAAQTGRSAFSEPQCGGDVGWSMKSEYRPQAGGLLSDAPSKGALETSFFIRLLLSLDILLHTLPLEPHG
jgi:hypothetical protein